MANFNRNGDIWNHIPFGEPVPARTFPDPEAARSYVVSGLDTAHELIRALIHDDRDDDHPVENDSYDLGVLVTDQIHRLRNALAAPPHMGRTAAVRELLRLGDRARAHDECNRRIRCRYFAKALLICAVVVGFGILPTALAAPVMFVLWRLGNGHLRERASELRRKEADVVEIGRAAAAVAGICELLA